MNIAKKLIVTLFVILSFLTFVSAEVANITNENVTSDGVSVTIENENEIITGGSADIELNVDEKELEILHDNLGAQIRLEQLKQRVMIQIDNANFIISEIKENLTEEEVRKSETIVSQFETIVEEINNFDYNRNQSEVASDFVALKAETINLTKEFRDVVSGKVSVGVGQKLREKVQARVNEKLKVKNQKIEQLRKAYNSKKASEIINKLGINDSELIERIKSGNITANEIRKEIYNKFKSLPNEVRKERLNKLVQERKEMRNKMKKRIKSIKKRAMQKRELIKNKIHQRSLNKGKVGVAMVKNNDIKLDLNKKPNIPFKVQNK